LVRQGESLFFPVPEGPLEVSRITHSPPVRHPFPPSLSASWSRVREFTSCLSLSLNPFLFLLNPLLSPSDTAPTTTKRRFPFGFSFFCWSSLAPPFFSTFLPFLQGSFYDWLAFIVSSVRRLSTWRRFLFLILFFLLGIQNMTLVPVD